MPKRVVIQKNATNRVEIGVTTYQGRTFLEMREFFLPEGGSQFIGTGKGCTLPLDKLDELKEKVASLTKE